jgi:hypothetical protein
MNKTELLAALRIAQKALSVGAMNGRKPTVKELNQAVAAIDSAVAMVSAATPAKG